MDSRNVAQGRIREAMCACGIPDLITHGLDGVMFDSHNLENMRSCLEGLVRDPAMGARLGAQGRITDMERFHPKVIAGEHLKIYR